MTFDKRKREPLDSNNAIDASVIIEQPNVLDHLFGPYILVIDISQKMRFDDLIHAINMMDARGWETLSVTSIGGNGLVALARRRDK